ncbi:hypothetical protein [Paenibacillus sp. FSL R7-0337]|uniref:hypothetical protein n=1 Tax=Paenibacillus sp. FSL R7-0337 TaxID=1926588 RepID=UPI00096D874F|nr:hypothetical protein [Paenibacillus sp. FSL R7-0337]OMF88734.1 hypothetical protein BK147_26370 [Paenibacillus sp. FSL R7-0337]
MNDSSLIYPTFTREFLKDYFQEELRKLEGIFDHSQIIITHVGPDASSVIQQYKNSPVSTFFYFDGSDLLIRANDKVWCYGHTHTHTDYHHTDGCRLINDALGYPIESTGARIKTIQF